MNLQSMAPYVTVSSSRFQVDLRKSHFSILNSTSSRLRQVKPTPLDLRSSSRRKSTYWGRLPGLPVSSPSLSCVTSVSIVLYSGLELALTHSTNSANSANSCGVNFTIFLLFQSFPMTSVAVDDNTDK